MRVCQKLEPAPCGFFVVRLPAALNVCDCRRTCPPSAIDSLAAIARERTTRPLPAHTASDITHCKPHDGGAVVGATMPYAQEMSKGCIIKRTSREQARLMPE